MRKAVIAIVILQASLLFAQPPDEYTMAYWKIDEGSGDFVEDSSSYGNHGTVENAVWVTDAVSGGAALEFNGQSSRVAVPDSPSLHPATGNITIGAWIKVFSDPKGWPNAGSIVHKQGAYQWAVNANGALWLGVWGSRLESIGSFDFTDHLNEWHHVATTYDNAAQHAWIYVDGELNIEGTVGAAIDQTTEGIWLGYKQDGDSWFHGLIDEVRISDIVRTQDEIMASMYGSAGFPSARGPQPEDGSILESTWANLSWKPGDFAISHDVYLGDNFDDVNSGAEGTFQGNQSTTLLTVGFPGFPLPDGLAPGTTYYWRIDEVNDAEPNSPWKGEVWSFFVPPREAYASDPADGAEFIDPDVTLTWKPGFNAKLHHVYFGDNFDDVNNAAGALPQSDAFEALDTLESDKTYYWRIDEFDGTNTHKGKVWTFTTVPIIPPAADPNLILWLKFDEGMGTTALDWSGNGNHGILFGPGWTKPGVFGDAAVNFTGSARVAIQNLTYESTDNEEVSVSLWIRTAIWNTQYIASFDRDQYWRVGININGVGPGLVGWHVMTSNGQVDLSSTTRVDNGAWHHVCGVFDNGRITIYIDGQPEGSITSGTTFGTGNIRYGILGVNNNATTFNGDTGIGSPIAGDLDDMRIYDRALTQEEITLVMRGDPLLAWNPNPTDGSTPDIKHSTPLTWSPGDNVSQHDVYFGTDRDTVNNADTSTAEVYQDRQNDTNFTPAEGVEWGGGPYYWRIDEYNTDETITKGKVWSFKVADFIGIDDFESYNDLDPDNPASNRIFNTWIDGFDNSAVNGAIVGYAAPPFAEQTIVHGGSQSMPYSYDNAVGYSEATMTLTEPRDWTEEGVGILSLWFRGNPTAFIEDPAGTFTVSASGTDIWDTADEFRYAYKQLSGAGSIVAQVLSVQNTHGMAKAGVMIRESLEPGSKNAFVCITPSNGVIAQARVTNDTTSASNSQAGITAPHWVKLERDSLGAFTASHSADGITWQPVEGDSPRLISMSQNVYIGLAVTSRNATATCTAEFSNVQTAGTVTPIAWSHQAIGTTMVSNEPELMYVALNDSAVVHHDNPNASQISDWTEWTIDLARFGDQGVNLTNVNTISIGFGDKNNPVAGGAGMVFFDDIRLYRPAP
ncbi:MAG: LamG domain-containing protein [Planctomycetes bacterium]|nr:LamG domain-containing protein [Planctomycetota bacterium]